MPLILTEAVAAQAVDRGTFSANRVSPRLFGRYSSPVVGLDHYRMDGITFAPHPHAGFSAVSYLFEDSVGGLRNRDSLGNDFVIEPGGLAWTQAGSGVVHDELPNRVGEEVHGVQIFVNLHSANKMVKPHAFELKRDDVPVWQNPDGISLRVVAGRFDGVSSPFAPAEPFNLYDVAMPAGTKIELPLASDWNMMIYCVEGHAIVSGDGGERDLPSQRYMAASARQGDQALRIEAQEASRVLLLSGQLIDEEVVEYGPFVMSNGQEVSDAVERYKRGEMGHLEPLQG